MKGNKNNQNDHVGTRIKVARNMLRMTGDEFVRQLALQGFKIDTSLLYRYENGKIAKFPINYVEPFAKALKVSKEYILGWETLEEMIERKQKKVLTNNHFFLQVIEIKEKDKDILSKTPIGFIQYQGNADQFMGLQLASHHLTPVVMEKDVMILDKSYQNIDEDELYLVFLTQTKEYSIRKVRKDGQYFLLYTYELLKSKEKLEKNQVEIIGKIIEIRRLVTNH